MQKDNPLETEAVAPERRYQLPVVWAFQNTIRKSRDPDGGVWWPARIIDELWALWSERPKEKGAKILFRDTYYQRVSRLRNEVTKGYIRDARLFYLVEKFVQKYADPEDVAPPARYIRLIHKTAQRFTEFAELSLEVGSLSRLYDALHRYNLEKSVIVSFRLTDVRILEGASPRNPLAERIFSYRPTKFADGHPEMDIEVHQEDLYYPCVCYRPDMLEMEMGFYVPAYSIAFLKTLTGSKVGRSDWEAENDTETSQRIEAARVGALRVLDFRSLDDGNLVTTDALGSSTNTGNAIFQKDAFSSSYNREHYRYAFQLCRDEDLNQISGRMLNFLDL